MKSVQSFWKRWFFFWCVITLVQLHWLPFKATLDAVFRLIKMHSDSDHSMAELSDVKCSARHVQTSSVQSTFEDMSHKNTAVVSHLRVFPAHARVCVCMSEPLAQERVRCLSRNVMGRQHQWRCRDEQIGFYFCPCRDSAALRSVPLGFRTSDGTCRSCSLSLRSFPRIAITMNRIRGGKKTEKKNREWKWSCAWDPCCAEQTGPCCIRSGKNLHENIFSRKNTNFAEVKQIYSQVLKLEKKTEIGFAVFIRDCLLVAWMSFTNVANKQVLSLKPNYWIFPSIAPEC